METALRRVAVKERKAQQAAAATQATEAWLESDAAEATPWGGGRRLSRTMLGLTVTLPLPLPLPLPLNLTPNQAALTQGGPAAQGRPHAG